MALDRIKRSTVSGDKQGIATATRDHQKVLPCSGSGVDNVEATFPTTVLPSEELVAPPHERMLVGTRMEGRRPHGSRAQHSDGETSSLEAAEG